jgi:hypothetical protein
VAEIDWDAIGTLHSEFGYAIGTDPLWILIVTARQGHEGDVNSLRIEMADGTIYGPDEINALARRRDRKGRPTV